MSKSSYSVQMEIEGETAMWTRVDSGDCPVSNIAPSYSAVKAIFEAILLGFKSLVNPTRVEICAPLEYHTYHTNYGGPLRQTRAVEEGNSFQLLATVLVNVCYRIYADVVLNRQNSGLSDKTLLWDKKTGSPGHAYQDIFNRRLKRGQCYSIPFLGWKEFTPSYFGPFREETKIQSDLNITIPSMLREVFSEGYNSRVSVTYDQNVVISKGVMIFTRRDTENGQ
jgi:CRISPR-associated protein Cas5d